MSKIYYFCREMCCKRFLQSTTSAPKAVQTQMLNIKNDNLMTKQRIEIEHELKSTSANIVWKLISTADGYANWLADSVTADGDELTFTWGQEWRHHEQRMHTLWQKNGSAEYVSTGTTTRKTYSWRYAWSDARSPAPTPSSSPTSPTRTTPTGFTAHGRRTSNGCMRQAESEP